MAPTISRLTRRARFRCWRSMLTEGPAIVQYVADMAPASRLIPPAGSKERYRAQEWLNFISSELHKNFSPLFRPNTPDDYKPIAKDNLASRFAYVDKHLPIDPISSATSSRWRTPICSPSSTGPSSSRSIWRRGRICSNSWPA
jgi:hypothetical protein